MDYNNIENIALIHWTESIDQNNKYKHGYLSPYAQ